MTYVQSIGAFILIILFQNSALAYHDKKLTPQYSKEKRCIAALSLARDFAETNGDRIRFKKLTEFQNKIYLKHPSGHFRTKHVKVDKILHKQRLKEKGQSYLKNELEKCGWK